MLPSLSALWPTEALPRPEVVEVRPWPTCHIVI